MVTSSPLQKHLQPRFSEFCNNIKHLDESVSIDPIFSNCRSISDHYKGAQIFYCMTSHCIKIYGFHKKGEFPRTLCEFIKKVGTPSILRRDNTKEEQSEEVLQITREAYIKDQYIEPYYPNQSPVESCVI
jgi:hypothetical protein